MVRLIEGPGITRPSTTRPRSSVLDHATVRDITNGFGLRNDDGLWVSYNCVGTATPTPICPDPLGVEDYFKEFATADWIPGYTFAMYAGVQCQTVGLDRADMESELRRVYEEIEGKGVERSLLDNRFVAATGSDAPWGAPTDLNSTGVEITPATALALVEGYAAANYAGVPTIHMPRAAASFLNERLVWEGDKAFTRLGSKVAVGGGYDEDPTAIEWDIYATGEVYVERSTKIELTEVVRPGDGSGMGSDQNGLEPNTTISLAERMYRVAVDCFVVKATGTVAPLEGANP